MPHIDLRLENVPRGRLVRLEHEGSGIVVMRRGETLHAYHDECPHAGWRLSEGELKDDVLECPAHGWEFSVETGSCLTVPDYHLTPVIVRRARGGFRLVWGASAEPHRGIAWSVASFAARARRLVSRFMDYALVAAALVLCTMALFAVVPAIRLRTRIPAQTRVLRSGGGCPRAKSGACPGCRARALVQPGPTAIAARHARSERRRA